MGEIAMSDRDSAVSVVIPTYNRRGLLPRALNSVLSQIHPAREIIVVDDGSTDGTADMVRTKYPQVKLIVQENRGVSAARNAGILCAGGEWLAFLDSDDEWLPKKLGRQLRLLDSHPEMKICHSGEIWLRQGRKISQKKKHRKPSGWIFQECLPLCAISPSSALIHGEIFKSAGLFDESLPACEDYDMWLRVSIRYEVFCVEEPLTIKHGGHPGQLSSQWGLDQYRIAALAKILESGILKKEDARAATKTLQTKCRIYAQGALKRGKPDDHEYFLKIARSYDSRSNGVSTQVK